MKNVSKKFDNTYVLKNINITFPRYGLVIINGPSGCGKSTLLNILATLLDFEGEVSFDGKSYSTISEQEKEELRIQKIGFIFQDFKLFDFESVKENICISLDLASGDKRFKKNKRIKDLLKVVNLTHKENELVSNLSGGEKQRVAIARALSNSPSILLADEPTGNLDEYNSRVIMKMLQNISGSSLVIMVSHDLSITSEYADEIIEMKDGEIINVSYQNRHKHKQYLPLLSLNYKNKNRYLPVRFIFKHTVFAIKRRKWRTLFITLSTSLGLIGVGLASTLSEIISDNLYRSYTSIIDDDKLVLSNNEKSVARDEINSADYDDVLSFYDDYKDDISHIGVYYLNNFDQFYSTLNNVSLTDNSTSSRPLPILSIKYINEFELLSENKQTIYPEKITTLNNDEVVLSAPFSFVNEICYQLEITRTLDSFSNYLKHNDVILSFNLANDPWSYDMFVPLKLKGFILSNRTCLYHSNPIWNEYIFESKLLMTTTNLLSTNSSRPWDLRKCYYLYFNKNRDSFLTHHRFDFNNQKYDFEIMTKDYCPILNEDKKPEEINRVLVITRTNKDTVPSYLGDYCKKTSKQIKSVIYGCANGYAIYEQNLMAGFAKSTYLSKDETSINDVIDLTSYIKYEESMSISLPNNVVEGHFSKSNLQGFVFEPNYALISGREPIDYHEIVVSIPLANKLGINGSVNNTIYLAFPVIENLLPNGFITREFETVGLKIVGISNSGKLAISHTEAWSIMFFQTMLGVSTLSLNIENISIQINKNYESDIIDKLNRAFPQFEIISPLSDVRDSVNQICYYIELIMLAVSITSIVIASLILFICNYLHLVEAKKDIGLIRCLGASKKESHKFIYSHALIMTSISLLTSISELLIISFILSKTLAETLQITSKLIFNPISIVYMFLTALIVSIVTSSLLSMRVSRLHPLDCLK